MKKLILLVLSVLVMLSLASCRRSDGGIPDLEFTLIEGKAEYALTKVNYNKGKKLVVPDKYEGLPVTGISLSLYSSTNLSFSTPLVNVTKIVIPKTVTLINQASLADALPSLEEFDVDKKNECFSSYKGNLYTKDGDTLIRYAHGQSDESFTVPDGVTAIALSAFANCRNLVEINIPKSVTGIGVKTPFDPNSPEDSDDYYYSPAWDFAGITSSTGTLTNNSTSVILKPSTSVGSDSSNKYEGSLDVNYSEIYTGTTTDQFITISPDSGTLNGSFTTTLTPGTSITTNGAVSNVITFAPSTEIIYATAIVTRSTIFVDTFQDCTNLSAINVDGDNSCYKSMNGSLYSKDGTVLIKYAKGKNTSEFKIPDSVTKIEKMAFANCQSLTSIIIPESVSEISSYAFAYCGNLQSLTIPDGVSKLGSYAFSHCERLVSVNVPAGVESFEDYVFDNCKSLTSVTIPSGVGTIGSLAFNSCTSLTAITLPGSVTEIGDSAFNGCTSLATVALPKGLTSIPNSLFTTCSALTEIEIPLGVTDIGDHAFSGSGITTVTIPDSVTTIGSSAFANCVNLTSITIPSSVTAIKNYTFRSCKSLTSVIISKGVAEIGDGAFEGCNNLSEIKIPSTVTSIGGSAFQNCNIRELIIPEGVISIGAKAFYACRSLESVYIPESVERIGQEAFNAPNASFYCKAYYHLDGWEWNCFGGEANVHFDYQW